MFVALKRIFSSAPVTQVLAALAVHDELKVQLSFYISNRRL